MSSCLALATFLLLRAILLLLSFIGAYYSFSLPCGGLSGVYGRSDQSRDEENFRSSTKKGIVTTTQFVR